MAAKELTINGVKYSRVGNDGTFDKKNGNGNGNGKGKRPKENGDKQNGSGETRKDKLEGRPWDNSKVEIGARVKVRGFTGVVTEKGHSSGVPYIVLSFAGGKPS